MHRLQDARRDPRAPDRLTRRDAKRASGRFAPSPTGPLHAGSLIAALASATFAATVDARVDRETDRDVGSAGPFTIRIDDLDRPRVVAGAEPAILDALRTHGLLDDDTPVVRQSDRVPDYERALARLADGGGLYLCGCSRRALKGAAVYPGHCRARRVGGDALAARLAATRAGEPLDGALRVALRGDLAVDDLVQGRRHVALERDVGDPVVHRRDGQIAWPLATAVDDARVTEVVRGADLFEPTVTQIALMDLLDLEPPVYAHVPVLIDAAGAKLGKSTGAPALAPTRALDTLRDAWRFLGQSPLDAGSVSAFHAAAREAFDLARIPRVAARHDPALSAIAMPERP